MANVGGQLLGNVVGHRPPRAEGGCTDHRPSGSQVAVTLHTICGSLPYSQAIADEHVVPASGTDEGHGATGHDTAPNVTSSVASTPASAVATASASEPPRAPASCVPPSLVAPHAASNARTEPAPPPIQIDLSMKITPQSTSRNDRIPRKEPRPGTRTDAHDRGCVRHPQQVWITGCPRLAAHVT
jgi:hypothetical protein